MFPVAPIIELRFGKFKFFFPQRINDPVRSGSSRLSTGTPSSWHTRGWRWGSYRCCTNKPRSSCSSASPQSSSRTPTSENTGRYCSSPAAAGASATSRTASPSGPSAGPAKARRRRQHRQDCVDAAGTGQTHSLSRAKSRMSCAPQRLSSISMPLISICAPARARTAMIPWSAGLVPLSAARCSSSCSAAVVR